MIAYTEIDSVKKLVLESRPLMELVRNMISCEPHTVAYRSTGSIPVPLRKASAPSDTKSLISNKGEG